MTVDKLGIPPEQHKVDEAESSLLEPVQLSGDAVPDTARAIK